MSLGEQVNRRQDSTVPGRIWCQLPVELAEHIACFLSGNDIASTLRLVNKAAAVQFHGLHTVLHLSQPTNPGVFKSYWGNPLSTRGLSLRKRRQLLYLTARSGVIANLELAIAHAGCLPTAGVFQAAAAAGHLHVCVWLLDRGCPSNGALVAAARSGQTAVCRWLLAADKATNGAEHVLYKALGAAVESGRRPVVELLINCAGQSQARFVTDAAYKSAVHSGHIDLFDWAMATFPQKFLPQSTWRAEEIYPADALPSAARSCNLPTLQRLYSEGLRGQRGGGGDSDGVASGGAGYEQPRARGYLSESKRARVVAAAAGSPTPDWRAKVELLLGLGWPLTLQAYEEAACRTDAADRLAWLKQRGGPPFGSRGLHDIVKLAAQAGNLATLQYLSAHGVTIHGPSASLAAARAGRLHVVAWLAEAPGVEVPMTAGLLSQAAVSGSLELLAWLRGRGCPWQRRSGNYSMWRPLRPEEETVFGSAVCAGNVQALEWLEEQGCPLEVPGIAYMEPFLNGDLATLRFLHERGFNWGSSGRPFELAAQADGRCRLWGWGGAPTLQALLTLGCPVHWKATRAEAGRSALRDRADVLDSVARWQQRRDQRRNGGGVHGEGHGDRKGKHGNGEEDRRAARHEGHEWDSRLYTPDDEHEERLLRVRLGLQLN